jgi:hypothetical protein
MTTPPSRSTVGSDVSRLAAGTPVFAILDFATQPTVVGGCTVYLPQPLTLLVAPGDAIGGSTLPMPVPFLQALRGLPIYAQGGAIDFTGGALFGEYSLTAGAAPRARRPANAPTPSRHRGRCGRGEDRRIRELALALARTTCPARGEP